MSKRLLYELHTQFTENQNSNLGNFIKLLTAMFALFGAMGYVYSHWEHNLVQPFHSKGEIIVFSTKTLWATIFVENILIALIVFLVICFGYSFRRDQILNDKIRKKFMRKHRYDYFFKNYGRNTDTLPGMYRIFFCFGILFHVILIILSIFARTTAKSYDIAFTVAVIASLISIIIEICYLNHSIHKLNDNKDEVNCSVGDEVFSVTKIVKKEEKIIYKKIIVRGKK